MIFAACALCALDYVTVQRTRSPIAYTQFVMLMSSGIRRNFLRLTEQRIVRFLDVFHLSFSSRFALGF